MAVSNKTALSLQGAANFMQGNSSSGTRAASQNTGRQSSPPSKTTTPARQSTASQQAVKPAAQNTGTAASNQNTATKQGSTTKQPAQNQNTQSTGAKQPAAPQQPAATPKSNGTGNTAAQNSAAKPAVSFQGAANLMAGGSQEKTTPNIVLLLSTLSYVADVTGMELEELLEAEELTGIIRGTMTSGAYKSYQKPVGTTLAGPAGQLEMQQLLMHEIELRELGLSLEMVYQSENEIFWDLIKYDGAKMYVGKQIMQRGSTEFDILDMKMSDRDMITFLLIGKLCGLDLGAEEIKAMQNQYTTFATTEAGWETYQQMQEIANEIRVTQTKYDINEKALEAVYETQRGKIAADLAADEGVQAYIRENPKAGGYKETEYYALKYIIQTGYKPEGPEEIWSQYKKVADGTYEEKSGGSFVERMPLWPNSIEETKVSAEEVKAYETQRKVQKEQQSNIDIMGEIKQLPSTVYNSVLAGVASKADALAGTVYGTYKWPMKAYDAWTEESKRLLPKEILNLEQTKTEWFQESLMEAEEDLLEATIGQLVTDEEIYTNARIQSNEVREGIATGKAWLASLGLFEVKKNLALTTTIPGSYVADTGMGITIAVPAEETVTAVVPGGALVTGLVVAINEIEAGKAEYLAQQNTRLMQGQGGGDGGNDKDPKGSGDVDPKITKAAETISNNAGEGKVKYGKNYHGRLDQKLEQEILSNPDAVYVTNNNSQNLVYRKGDNVVIVESRGSSKGNVITSYGPSGPRGESGAAIYGGSPSDPGLPVTHDDILNGIKQPGGGTFPPATQIKINHR